MTGPLDFLYRNQSPASPAAPTPQPSGGLDFLYKGSSAPAETPTSPSTQQGFLEWTKNVASNWWKTSDVDGKMEIEKLTGQTFQYTPDEQIIKNAILQGKQSGNGTDLAISDFARFGAKMFNDVKAQLGQVLSSPGATVDQIKNDFPGFLGGIAKAFATPISDFGELEYGVKLTGEEVQPLSPEEKKDRIKNLVATTAMLATGAGVAKGLGAGSTALRAAVAAEEATVGASGLATDAFASASRLTAKGAFGRELLKNTAVAATSGASYGMVRYANEDDQLAQTLINGVVMAPLGVAFELAGLGKGTKERLSVAKRAGDVAVLRQAQNVFDNTIPGVVNNVEALATADNLAEGVFNGQIKTKGNDIIHIPGVSSEQMTKLAVHVPDDMVAVHYFDPSGDTGNILLYNKQYEGLIDKKFYAENGYAKDQVVSYKGKDFKVADGNGKTLTIENLQDPANRVTVDRNFVRPGAGADFGSPEIRSEPKEIPPDVQSRIEVLERISNGLNVARPLREEAKNQLEQVRAQYTNTSIRFGQLDKDAAVDRMYNEWKQQVQAPQPGPLDLAYEERRILGEKMSNASPEEMSALVNQSEKLEAQIKKLETLSTDPIGFDEMPPDNLVDQSPERGTNYLASMRDFFTGKGFDPESHQALSREFEKRLAIEAHSAELPPEEQKFINDAHAQVDAQVQAEDQARAKKHHLDSETLIRHANSNGFNVSVGDSGLSLRDAESGRVMFKTDNLHDAMDFIDKSGQAQGVDLDPGGAISSNAAARGRGLSGANTPVNDNPVYKFFGSVKNTAKNLSSENAIRFLDNFALITRNREYFTGLDTKYGTQFFSRVFDTTQSARRVANAKVRPYYEKLQGIEKIVAKMSPGDRELIGRWMQTMTPDEVKTRFKTRPMNPVEVKMAEGIAAKNVDLERVFGYRRELKKIGKEFADAKTPEEVAQRDQIVSQAKDHFGIDDTHQQVVDAFDTIEGMGKKEADMGAIVRLVRSMQDGELSRPDFAAKHKMSFEQLRAGNQLEALYKELATTFNIPPEHRLGGYMTHARLYADGNVSEALRMFGGDTQARDFYAKMARTGEITAYEMDPIRAMQRYIKGGFDAIHFSEAYANAKDAAVEEIKRLPAGMQKHVQDVTERYLSDLRGFPGAAEAATQAAVDNLLEKFKVDADVSVRKQIVNGITAIVPAATQGIRIMAGVRDFATHMMMYSSRFGYSRMGRAIVLGAKAMAGPIREELERIGDITVASPITFADATEQAGGALAGARTAFAKGLDRTTKAMFRLSGQQDVYAMMHAGAYLETREVAAQSLLKLSRGEGKWADVVKDTKLMTYDQPVVDKFKSLAEEGKTDEAARFLAIQTGYEQIGVFGLANQPYLWGTNLGRIVGQYGNWPTWLRGNLTRMASRGTPGQRIASMARLAASTAALSVAGKELGLDLSSWSPIKGLFFAGGPLVDVYETLSDAFGGSGYMQTSAQRRLGKMLPWNQLKQIYLPGSYFADDVVKAIQQFQRGQNLTAAAQIGGFHPTNPTPGI